MRRFGGIEFLQVNETTTLELIDETTINQLHSLSDRNDATAKTINATKVASLFRVHLPQASVSDWSFHFDTENVISLPRYFQRKQQSVGSIVLH
jgi:hypothetical protein